MCWSSESLSSLFSWRPGCLRPLNWATLVCTSLGPERLDAPESVWSAGIEKKYNMHDGESWRKAIKHRCDWVSATLAVNYCLILLKAQIDADIHERVFCPWSVLPLPPPPSASASAFPLCSSLKEEEEEEPSVALGLGDLWPEVSGWLSSAATSRTCTRTGRKLCSVFTNSPLCSPPLPCKSQSDHSLHDNIITLF